MASTVNAPVTVANAKALTITATPDKVTKVLPFAKGKGSDARNLAIGDVATYSYIEGNSRADTVRTLRTALGNKPTEAQVNACKLEFIVGRVASALKHGDGAFAHITFARDVVTQRAAPLQDGVKARGKKVRRTVEQHKAVRAAESAWSLIKAEVTPALSKAATMAQKNAKAKRAPSMAGSGKGKASPETLTQLATPAAPMTAADTVQHMVTQSAALLAFANKHAKLLPAGMGASVRAFHKSIASDAATFASLNG